MTNEEKLELANIFLSDHPRGAIYQMVKDFIVTHRSNDRSRILSVVKPLMGGDHAEDRRITDTILNG